MANLKGDNCGESEKDYHTLNDPLVAEIPFLRTPETESTKGTRGSGHRTRRSAIYNDVKILEDGTRKCNHCNAVYSRSTSTDIIQRHIDKFHR